ncbi:TPA: hypothetical protein N0F65_002089 [Lagenidium giganteum]|uniref:Uncharacterized protein n=1 Tax=Lagenidium giganteum TaxID=4803 RepID=A0AAV2ZC46_9STRA|nr:TPA: hypothetical protein N0F65_002089 [Lagenidium giganteum]
MEQVRRCHETLMQQRTHIRHHKSILAWMRRVWTRVPRADTQRLTIDEYEDFYSTLLYEMTVCWEEEVNNSVLDKMWKRDAAHFDHLDFDRFCCSIFYFVEMWVEEITRDEYERIFAFIHRISMGNSNTAPSTTTAFKPTLESFHSALDNEQTMEDMALNIGKSIFFDAERYYQSFGTASIPTQIVAPLCVPNQGSGSLDAMTKAGTADHEAAERNSVMASLHQVPNRPKKGDQGIAQAGGHALGAMGATDGPTPALRILELLELSKVAIVEQLLLIVNKLRPQQQETLVELLQSYQDATRAFLAAYFDRKLDVRKELDDYLQDLIKIQHYVSHHSNDERLNARMLEFYGSLGQQHDRALLTKAFQTLGFALAGTLCDVVASLQLKWQREFLALFSENLADLKQWIEWIAALSAKKAANNADATSAMTTVTSFLVKVLPERATMLWLTLLRPLSAGLRLAVITQTAKFQPETIKQLGRFLDTTGTAPQRLLDLHPAFLDHLAEFLDEFPAATLMTLVAKFNDEQLVATIQVARSKLSKKDLLRLIDTLSTAETPKLRRFFLAVFRHSKTTDVLRLFYNFSSVNQLHFLDLVGIPSSLGAHKISVGTTHADRTEPTVVQSEESALSDALLVFDLFLHAHFRSSDAVVQKLWSTPKSAIGTLLRCMKAYSPEDLQQLGEGIEPVHPACLEVYLRCFDFVAQDLRSSLVHHVKDMPGGEALPLYEVLLKLHEREQPEELSNVVKMIARLKREDKDLLCSAILTPAATKPNGNNPGGDQQPHVIVQGVDERNQQVLLFLCDAVMSERKVIRLLAVIPQESYHQLLYLLRTQRPAEQLALTRLMLSLSTAANCRALVKIGRLETDQLDEFFQLLLLTPKHEYKQIARLLVSTDVSVEQFQCVVSVATNLMNQASTRELITFTSGLPTTERHVFLAILAERNMVKGVIMRIVACSTKMSQSLMCQLIALLKPLPWEVRSALIEHVRALDEEDQIAELVALVQGLEAPTDVAKLVHMFNLLPPTVRVAIVPVLSELESEERKAVLDRLDHMPKDVLPDYCTVVSDAEYRSVAVCFLRVLGLADVAFQKSLLDHLRLPSCWYFFAVLSEFCVRKSRDVTVVNALVTAMFMLQLPDEFTLLRNVTECALASGIHLEALVLVFAHFRDKTRFLQFLRYADGFTQTMRVSDLFFRVLCKYRQTEFLYDMCCMLDADDAVFALKRLDRMWSSHAQRLETALDQLAANHAKQPANERGVIKDAFCNLIMGFKETEARFPSGNGDPASPRGKNKQYISPRPTTKDSSPSPTDRDRNRHAAFLTCLDDPEALIEESTPSRLSPRPLRPVRVDNHVRRWQVQRKRHRIPWWQLNYGEEPVIPLTPPPTVEPPMTANNYPSRAATVNVTETPVYLAGDHIEPLVVDTNWMASDRDRELWPSLSPSATSCESPGATDWNELSLSMAGEDSAKELPDAAEEHSPPHSPPIALPAVPTHRHSASLSVLPPISGVVALGTTPKDRRPQSCHSLISLPPSSQLTRSETAPASIAIEKQEPEMTVLPPTSVSKAKLQRGLTRALELVPEHRTHRDRGMSIFQKQCQRIQEEAPTRIRIAKTAKAQSMVLEARAQKALGKRLSNPVVSSTPPRPRCAEKLTIKRAEAVLMAAVKMRTSKRHLHGA